MGSENKTRLINFILLQFYLILLQIVFKLCNASTSNLSMVTEEYHNHMIVDLFLLIDTKISISAVATISFTSYAKRTLGSL